MATVRAGTSADRDALGSNPDLCPGNPDFRGAHYYAFDQRTFPSVMLHVRRSLSGPWQVAAGYRFRTRGSRGFEEQPIARQRVLATA